MSGTPMLPLVAARTTRRVLLAPGTELEGKYRIEHVLGNGGMGWVVAATHLQLGERVAIKMLLPELVGRRDVVERFLREARAAARLKSEHVVRALDVGILGGRLPYLVMEYLEGTDLASWLAARGPLPAGEAIDIVLPVCAALAEAHARGIIHRDIKPANVFLAQRPDGSRLVKVLDFGISKLGGCGDGLTGAFESMGTPGYAAPEQVLSLRDVDARADVWSVGVMLHECLTGRLPSSGDRWPTWVPPAVAAAVDRCREIDRDLRYSTMSELAAALAPHAHDAVTAQTVALRTRAVEQVLSGTPPPARSLVDTPIARGDRERTGSAAGVSRRSLTGAFTALAGLMVCVAIALAVHPDLAAGDDRRASGPGAQPAPVADTTQRGAMPKPDVTTMRAPDVAPIPPAVAPSGDAPRQDGVPTVTAPGAARRRRVPGGGWRSGDRARDDGGDCRAYVSGGPLSPCHLR